ncbi:hypothetical protein G9A89_017789 [Geosiphon pyriformis]|nr:hypothetical protein G9A89_017789 [Geosiphon pyriformis]
MSRWELRLGKKKKAAFSGSSSSLKAPLSASFGPAGGSFSQKKRVSFCNVKHFGVKGDVFLAKPHSDGNIYSDMESDFSSSIVDNILVGSSNKSFFGLVAITPKAKKVKNNLACGSSLGSLDYDIDNNDGGFFSPPLGVSLKKKWLDPKIIKTQVKVAVKKSYALDINLSTVEGKSAMTKTQVIRNLFSKINSFGGTTTSLKFEGIIRFIFTLEISIEKATLLARKKGITVNTDLKKQGIRSDWAIVIKKIPMDTPKGMIIAALSEFVCVAKAVEDHETWISRDQFRVLLFTLPVGTTVHNLRNFLERAGGKTCVINWLLESDNRTRCAVVGFESDEMLELAFCTVLILGKVKLSWTRLGLVWCNRCEKLGYSVLECNAKIASTPKLSKSFIKWVTLDEIRLQLVKLYAKKSVLISRLAAFGSKLWAQIISFVSTSFGLFVGSDLSLFSSGGPGSGSLSSSTFMLDSVLNKCLLVPLVSVLNETPAMSVSQPFASVPSVVANSNFSSDMVLDSLGGLSNTPFPIAIDSPVLGLNSSKVLTSKLGSLESKFVALEVLVNSILVSLVWNIAMCNVRGMNNPVKQDDIICWHKEMNNVILIVTETKLKGKICPWIINKFNSIRVFTSGLNSGHLDSRVAIIMNNFLAQHVCKVLNIPDQFLFLRLLFKNNLSVSVLGLYAGASLASSFVILGGDFNEDDSYKSASFKRCFDLGLVNFLGKSLYGKKAMWNNSRGIAKTIDYIFVSSNLVNVILDCKVAGIEKFFNTDYKVVFVSVDLGGLLDSKFKDKTVANATMFFDDFLNTKMCSDLDAMWNAVHKTLCFSANVVFKKKWFKEYNGVFIKTLSRFHRLELLMSKLVKASQLINRDVFTSLLKTWILLDSANALLVKSLFFLGSSLNDIRSVLSKIRKFYRASKLLESKCAEDSYIRSAINRRMESFKSDKDHTIRSVLKQPFCKVILDYLVVNEELILEPNHVKNKVDEIIKGVVHDVPEDWSHQYQPLEHVFDGAFSNVMNCISFVELFGVVSNLPDKKAAGFSGIFNKLWKHCDSLALNMLLVLINFYLSDGLISGEGVLTNTHHIALIETVRKILSKILSDRISLACSKYNVLCGDNFSFPIFAVGSMIENTIKKNQKLWLVLQDMQKTYDSVGWEHLRNSLVRIKIGYHVHDGLNQEEIFYDPLLCKVKRQKSVCRYRLNSHFVSRTGHVESQAELTSFLAAGAFMDDTIWVGNNIASEFFRLNDISINNNKTIVIPINCWIANLSLLISEMSISVAKKGEPHWYLGIFLSTESLFKPSLAKAYSDIKFFANFVLKKTISDKQFLYLVSSILHPIVNYRTQFSFDTLIRKGLKSKSGLSLDFPNNALYYFSLYGLNTFEQIQAEYKVVFVVCFANSVGILDCLFAHRSHDLQILCWHPIYSLSSPACIGVGASDNFLAGLVCIFYDYNLSLGGIRANAFHLWKETPMVFVLSKFRFVRCLPSFWCYGVAFVDQLRDHSRTAFTWATFKCWKWLDPRGPVSVWFDLSVFFINMVAPISVTSSAVSGIRDRLLGVGTDSILVYTDNFLAGLGTVSIWAGAAVFFDGVDLGLGVEVSGLVSSTMAELQTIALALECVPLSSSVYLFFDSQAALNACKSELGLVKNLNICWFKVKRHSGVVGNECVDTLTTATAMSEHSLLLRVNACYILAGGMVVSGNSRHFVHDILCCVYHAQWEIGSGFRVLVTSLRGDVDWHRSFLVWHPDMHMTAGSTGKHSAIEVSDHVFACGSDTAIHLSGEHSPVYSGHHHDLCSLCSLAFMTLCCVWRFKVVSVFRDLKIACQKVVEFVQNFCLAFRDEVWLVYMSYHALIEKCGLIPRDGSVSGLVRGLSLLFFTGVIKMLGIVEAFGISFGFCIPCLFFLGIGNSVLVIIDA